MQKIIVDDIMVIEKLVSIPTGISIFNTFQIIHEIGEKIVVGQKSLLKTGLHL